MARGVREGRKALAATLLGMLLIALPLESRGLHTWAERLDVGGFRSLALTASGHLADVTERTPLPSARSTLLDAVSAFPAKGKAVLAASTEESGASVQEKPEPLPVQQTKVQPITVAAKPPESGAASAAKTAAPAKDAPVAVAVTEAKPLLPQDADLRPITVALVGDSMMAVGLGPYLTRELSAMPGVRVVRAYRSGTGLARPEVFNWLEQYPKLVGNTHPDLIICAIGANDAQNFVLDGKPVAFGSEEWNQEYQHRVGSLLDEMAPGETPVLWLALPSMRSEKFSQRVFRLNDVVKEALARKSSVVWMESNPLLGGGKTTYVEFQKNSKQKLERLRQDDGIHFSDAGASRIGPSIVAWVARQRGQSRSAQGSSISAGL